MYVPGLGGARTEDTVVVTEAGCEILTMTPKEFSPPCFEAMGKRAPERGAANMAAVSTNDLKNGMTLNLPEGLFSVVEFQHVKPGKGGAFVRTKLKNLRTGAVIDRTYRADERLDQAIIDKREMQFLYSDGGSYVFMDNTDYEQMKSPRTALGAAANFLKEGDSALLQFYDDEIIGVDLPAAVELTVTQTEPGVQGDRVPGPGNRQSWRPASRSKCPFSSTRVTGSRSTLAAAST